MDHSSPGASGAFFAGLGIMWIFILAVMVLGLIVNWRIVSKAGYNGALSLLALIPLVGFIMMVVFAFTKWPIEERVESLQAPH